MAKVDVTADEVVVPAGRNQVVAGPVLTGSNVQSTLVWRKNEYLRVLVREESDTKVVSSSIQWFVKVFEDDLLIWC